MRTPARLAATLLSTALALSVAACSSDGPATEANTPTPSAAPALDSFEKIGDAIGCLSLSNSDPETTDIQDNKYCTLEQPTTEGGTVTVYQYADVARRDKALKAGLVFEQSFLVLSDNWAISGDPRDLRKIKALLNQGELRTAEPTEAPNGDGSVGPGDAEEGMDGYEVEEVALGKAVTYQDERVQAGKIYCDGVEGDDSNKQFDSCRLTRLSDGYEDQKAAKGREFYLVAFRWKNVGKGPVIPTDFGTLVTDKGLEFAEESELSDALTTGARGNEDFDASSENNPGTTGRILLAYEIPKGTKVKAVHWGLDSSYEGPPAYALAVK